jgi:hypothetical protein
VSAELVAQAQAHARKSAEARLELGMAAASAERRNRPRAPIVLAALALVGAFVYAGTGLAARSAAFDKLATDRNAAARLQALLNDVDALKRRDAARGFAADANVAAKLERLAKQFELQLQAPITDMASGAFGSAGGGRLVEKRYSARFAGQDPVALLDWLKAAQSGGEAPGLEVARLAMRTNAPMGDAAAGSGVGGGGAGWTLDVDFTRWEKP